MRTILVDDQPLTMPFFEDQCKNTAFFKIVGTFQNPIDALQFAKQNPIDFAVLDIDMPQMNGSDLGKSLREYYPELIIFYITAHD